MRSALAFLTAAILWAAACSTPAIALQFETIPDDGTIVYDDSAVVLMREYVQRARESMAQEEGRTAAWQLRRVADLAGQAADRASGEAKTALHNIRTQALRLAYAAERNRDSSLRRIREFELRTDNFLMAGWPLLEAEYHLKRGRTAPARDYLTVAVQQLSRRAMRAGKVRGEAYDEAATRVATLLNDLDTLKSGEAEKEVAALVKEAQDLEPARRAAEEDSSPYSRGYGSTSPYSTDRYGDGRSGTGMRSGERSPYGGYGTSGYGRVAEPGTETDEDDSGSDAAEPPDYGWMNEEMADTPTTGSAEPKSDNGAMRE